MRSEADRAPAWLHVPALAAAERVTLEVDEAHYVSRVVRASQGDRLTATDGLGQVATLELTHVRPSVELRVLERRAVPRPPSRELWCGAPEGDRADWLVEKLAELGATRFVPLDLERAAWTRAGARRARWDRLAIAALRQSRRAWRLEIAPPARLEAAIERSSADGQRWLADPAGRPAGEWGSADDPRLGAVGPSAGFSDSERDFLQDNGFSPIRLSGARLRTETAALALVAAWAAGD